MKNRTHIRSHGLNLLLSGHPEIKKLKKNYQPSTHGNKVWRTSWLLVDYLKKQQLITSRHKVLDVGCGWGICGICCARTYHAKVICADIDPDVYPYLNLHAEINKVKIDFLKLGFDQIKSKLLKDIDVIVGADICFWDNLVDPLRRLIQRAKRASVKLILLADPGRPTFDDLSEFFIHKSGAELLEWEIKKPYSTSGKILHIES